MACGMPRFEARSGEDVRGAVKKFSRDVCPLHVLSIDARI